MISNKEVIDKVVEHLLTQDPRTVARLLANAMVDYNRLANIDQVGPKELENLKWRIKKNSDEVQDFVINGATKPLRAIVVNSDD